MDRKELDQIIPGTKLLAEITLHSHDESGVDYYIIKNWDGENVLIFPHPEVVRLIPEQKNTPFNVYFDKGNVHVRKGEQVISSYNLAAHPHAKETAQEECNRLIAEWRKKVGTEVPCSEDGKEGLV